MRLSSASLLLGSTSVLSALFVSAAPVLVRISLIGHEQPTPNYVANDLIRFIRIGGPGALANVMHSPPGQADLDRINAAILRSGILADLNPDANTPVRIEGERLNPGAGSASTSASAPMRPEWEFTPEQLEEEPEMQFEPVSTQDVMMGCSDNLWNRFVGRINDFFVDMFGFPTERRSVRCNGAGSRSIQVPVQQRPQTYNATAAYSGVPYHRNGAPLDMVPPIPNFYAGGSPRFRPWAYRHRPTTFGGRIQRALYALSPWEGRAVAFVMGCGLGVLIRMLFVLIVLGARALRGSSKSRSHWAGHDEEKDEYDRVSVILGDEEVEGVVLFDAGSINGASVEDLPLYEEKQ